MANWCEGKLKIKGTRENIIRFINEGIKSIDIFGNELKHRVEISELYEDTSQSVDLCKEKNHYRYYMEGTRRGFIEIPDIEFHGDEEQIIVGQFEQAWNILTADLVEISKKFNLDLKIYGFERGMEFNRDIEIIDGEVIKDDIIEFDDYNWDCIDPTLGG